MNYRDFFKTKKSSVKKTKSFLPEGVTESEYKKGFQFEMANVNDPYVARNLTLRNLREDVNYYSKITEDVGTEIDALEFDPENDTDDALGGYPKVDGALAIHHHGQPIRLGKIVQVGGEFGKGPASGAVSGYTDVGGCESNKEGGTSTDSNILQVNDNGKEPITAGGKKVDSSIASKSVGGPVVPGEGQKQGGLNSQGTIASTAKLNEGKETVRRIVKEVLKEITFDKKSGKWVRITEGKKCNCGKSKGDCKCMQETIDMKMGPSYKVVQPRQYKVQDDDFARTNQYEPEITEMYDDEEECMMNERYVELANSQRNLSESELSELKSLREKIDRLSENDHWIQKAVKHPGRCAHPGSEACPKGSPQYNLAMRFKHGDIHKDNVGEAELSEEDNVKCPKCGGDFSTNYGTEPKCPTCETLSDEELGEMGETTFNMNETPCEDYPCCGHEQGQCPTRDSHGNSQEDGDFGQEDFQETVDMKTGPSYKVVQPRQYKVQDDDFARTNQYDPEITEVGGQSVQHSSYRTVNHGNLAQDPKTRWADDLDEGESKVAKAISKGQKGKTTLKNPKLKHEHPKKTTSGVHKRKT